MAESDIEDFSEMSVADIASEIATCQFRMCQAYGFEEIVKRLEVRSGQAYASRQDARAQIYRELAGDFEEEAKRLRIEIHNPWSKRKDALFAELDRRERADQHS